MQQRDCVSAKQALQRCFASAPAEDNKGAKCQEFVQALQACGMHTARNNYPVNTLYMT
jgi:hypothetical protein